MQVLIDAEIRSIIPPIAAEEYKALEESIVDEGCRDALVIWKEKSCILDGHNRYDICTKHNIPYRTFKKPFADQDEAIIWVIDNQFARRNINNYQRSVLALKREDVIAKKAKERQKEAGELYHKGSPKVPQKSAEVSIETREELAKLAKVSHDTISKVKKIEEKAPEELKEKLREGVVSINEGYKQVKDKDKAQQERMKPKFDRLKEIEKQGIYIGSVWDFGKRADYAGDGNFHGNCIPQVVENAILFYTAKDDLVLDPMAGSGTTIDVCQRLERRWLAFDIKPTRADIQMVDARNLEHLGAQSVDFVFLHPPYWKLVSYTKDGEHQGDLSRLDYQAFLDAMNLVFAECHRVLKGNKVLTLLIGDLVTERHFVPIAIPLFNLATQQQFDPIGIAIKTTENSKSQVLKGKTIWAEVAFTQNLKVEHDYVMMFRKNGKV